MHRLTALALIAFATGCSGDSVSMQLEGEIFSDARGLAIQDDGQRVHMGMDWGTTCAFDLDGTFQEDYDFPTETDRIHDARRGAALGSSTEGLHFIGSNMADVPMPGVIGAALGDSGAIALTSVAGDCELAFVDAGTPLSVPLDLDCGDGELDTIDGLALVGSASGAQLVSEGGDVISLAGGQEIAANRTAGMVYSGDRGASALFASSTDGSTLWDLDLGGSLVDIADMGAAGMVVASVEREGRGQVVFVDADSGEVINEIEVPSGEQLSASEDGRTLAIVGEWETRLYSVDRDNGGMKFYTSPEDAGFQTQPMGD